MAIGRFADRSYGPHQALEVGALRRQRMYFPYCLPLQFVVTRTARWTAIGNKEKKQRKL